MAEGYFSARALACGSVSKIDLSRRDSCGRRVVAARDVKRGEVVLKSEAEPIPVLHVHLWDRFCGACLFGKARFRCTRCKIQRYCSRACQKRAWKKGHRKECDVLSAYFCSGNTPGLDVALLSDALLLGRTVQRMRSCGEFRETVLGMVHSSHSRDLVEEAREISRFATSSGLVVVDGIDEPFDLEKILLRFRCNNFAVVNHLFVSTASAIFPAGAMLNHSCEPSCIPTYRIVAGSRIEQQFRAARDIRAGEELTHPYVDIAWLTSARNEHLERFYGFRCTCRYCTGKHALRKSLEDNISSCRSGGAHEHALSEASDIFNAAERADSPRKELELYELCLEKRSKCLQPEDPVMIQTASRAFDAALCCSDTASMLSHSKTLAGVYERVYGRTHPLSGLKYYTLGDCLSRASKQAEAIEAWAIAADILAATHGKDANITQSVPGQ